MNNTNVLDITPSPRILRTLGEIPFSTWQCVAELIDNSIDAFMLEKNSGSNNAERRITVSWSSDALSASDRTIEIIDNACGMSIDQLQNAVRAGYSSNDPVKTLGLFGMGFNIATARLGDVTTIMSTRKNDTSWVGLKIDFDELISTKRFTAPIIQFEKQDPNESGTKITISKLKHGILTELPYKEYEIRQRLEAIYSPLLNTQEVTILIKGKQLRPHNHCVWAPSRYVRYLNQDVCARINIDRNLGTVLFDMLRNSYLTPDEAESYYIDMSNGEPLPENIIKRSKRLTGWLGIQRYADPNDFGIDFIRNGRKILISDKSLFQYENPLTGQKELQYPLELGTSIGGRIVGELYVDYLLPTYQKNDFDRTDNSWIQTVEAICGVGPFLPRRRRALGFTEPNNSPLCLLANAYRRIDKGTKCLFAPNDVSKKYFKEFQKGTLTYLDDTLWWKAAQEEDQKQNTGGMRTTLVNTGDGLSDNIGSYLSDHGTNDDIVDTDANNINSDEPGVVSTSIPTELESSQLDELIQRSNSVTQLTGRNYRFGNTGSLNVRVYELKSGDIKYRGERKPCFFYSDGVDCDFVYDPTHEIISQYPISPEILLLIYLAEKLKARDCLPDLVSVYSELVKTTMRDYRIDRQSLQDRAYSVFETLREKMRSALRGREIDVINCIYESSGEVEDTVTNILQHNPALLSAFQSKSESGFDAIDYIPHKTVYRIIERFPENVFDGKVLQTPYMIIDLGDEKSTQRAREESKDRTMSFLKDALHVISGYSQRVQKDELTRASLSVDFLIKELGT